MNRCTLIDEILHARVPLEPCWISRSSVKVQGHTSFIGVCLCAWCSYPWTVLSLEQGLMILLLVVCLRYFQLSLSLLHRVQEYADQLRIPFLETSAKSATNVEQAFVTMAAEIKARVGPAASASADPRANIRINTSTPVSQQTSFGCCWEGGVSCRDLRSFEIRLDSNRSFRSDLIRKSWANFRIGRACPLLVVVKRLKPLTAGVPAVLKLLSCREIVLKFEIVLKSQSFSTNVLILTVVVRVQWQFNVLFVIVPYFETVTIMVSCVTLPW